MNVAAAGAAAEGAAGLQIEPLPGAHFGVRVHATGAQTVHAHLPALLGRHRVLVLQGLRLDVDAFLRLASKLGQVRPTSVRHPSLSGVAGEHVYVSARDLASIPIGATRADAPHGWHADYSQSTHVPRWSMLYAVRAPATGGCNSFMDMARVHAALPQALKDEVEALHARHYMHPQGVELMPPDRQFSPNWEVRDRGVAHPLVFRDATGQPSLFLPSQRDSPVLGLDEAHSRALLDRLWDHVEAHGQAWEYRLADDELLIWDNRVLLHRRSGWPRNEERLLWFLTTA